MTGPSLLPEKSFTAAAYRSGVLVVSEDTQAAELRGAIGAVQSGLTSVKVPKQLENFSQVLADEAGLSICARREDEEAFVLDMLRDSGTKEELYAAAEALFDRLADGEMKALALPPSSRFRAALVKVAKDRGLPSMNTSDGHLQIGQLHVFIKEVEEIVERLEDDQEHDFGSELSSLHRLVVRQKSMAAGLFMTEEESVRIRRVALPSVDKTQALEEQRKMTEASFKKFASGRLGHQIFLRRGDLQRLLEEGEHTEEFKARLGQVFDDTLQLQLDVLGQNYGLSKEYWQVFLTKASNELSWRPKFEVLEAFEELMDAQMDTAMERQSSC
ncbi:Hypothetical protein SCF082_LOCUS13563 [Durusdinium trenchii]|uniref:Uncharacterized protein n=1 Tax=Durusdinium trenchii TaxID=1381693 RepID=A0ABP0JSP3_9DINO